MKYTFTDWKRIVCCFFTMHPSNLDHKDMQRRGVQTFQARVGLGGVGGWGSLEGRGGGEGGCHEIKQRRLAGRAW